MLVQVISAEAVNYTAHVASMMAECEAAGVEIPGQVQRSLYRK